MAWRPEIYYKERPRHWTPVTRRSVFIRTKEGHKTYAVDLDSRLSTGEWESKYLSEGFREPDTGRVIPARALQAVSVKDIGEPHPDMPDTRPAMQWLHDQVEEICALGLSV